MNLNPGYPPWLVELSGEDLAFLKRFLLNSGSLKALAAEYGISYPTVRLRLDRLIAKIRAVDGAAERSPFERRLRALHAEGRIDFETLRELLGLHEAEVAGPEAAVSPTAPDNRNPNDAEPSCTSPSP